MNLDIIERTPEQLAAIAARKIKILEDRDKEEKAKTKRGRRRIIDYDATSKRLLKKKLVTQHWIDRKSPAELRHYVKLACIGYQVNPISVTGSEIEVLALTIGRNVFY